MSVTMYEPKYLGANTWLISYSSDLTDPDFYVWIDGVFAFRASQTKVPLYFDDGSGTIIDVFDSVTDTPGGAYPGRMMIQWYCLTGADYYSLQEYVDSTWTERDTVNDDGRGYYQWTSRYIEDITSHSFRVVPYSANGNSGDALELLTLLMVRHPDVPDVTYTYSSATRKITITED